jgi:hypothetical protein
VYEHLWLFFIFAAAEKGLLQASLYFFRIGTPTSVPKPTQRGSERMQGRHKKIKNKKQMERLIDGYFGSLKGHPVLDKEGCPLYDKYGMPVVVPDKPPTVAGLCRALGFKSRQSLYNYRKYGEYCEVIDEAILIIEEYTESRLFDRDGVAGAKFSLANNFGWREKQTVDINPGSEYGGVVLLSPVEEERS